MGHPLIARPTDAFGPPSLAKMGEVGAFTAGPGLHSLFVACDPGQNPESTDAAVPLPQLHSAFQGRFDRAVVDAAIDEAVRIAAGADKTPRPLIHRDGLL
jgi:hypothetical protein